MKRIIMAALLSLMLWTGATVAAHAEDAVRQESSEAATVEVADTPGDMTESEAYRIRMAEIEKKRQVISSFIPILGITMPFIFAFLVIFFVIYYRNKQKQAHYQIIETAIEAGRELPDQFFETSGPKQAQPGKLAALNQGLIFLGIGLGLAVWSIVKWCIGGTEAFAGGYGLFIFGLALICILVGAGKLVFYRVSSREEDSGSGTEQAD